jgi:hypothetical protein
VKNKQQRRLIFLIAGLGLAAVLAVFLREPVRAYVILPLTQFFWLARGYYGSLPQSSYYILLMAIVGLIGLVSFRLSDFGDWTRGEGKNTIHGEVQQMAFWFDRAHHSAYSRWHVARSLAELAMDLIGKRMGSDRRGQQLEGPGWNPPPDIQDYLQSALRLSPANFSKYIPSSDAARLGQDPEPAVSYLETIMENKNEH